MTRMAVHGAALSGHYNDKLVVLSVLVAILAAYAAPELAGRTTAARGVMRAAWLAGGAFSLGLGIWCMHYVGMEAYILPVPVFYHWPTVLLSMVAAIVASAIAIFVVSRFVYRQGSGRNCVRIGSLPVTKMEQSSREDCMTHFGKDPGSPESLADRFVYLTLKKPRSPELLDTAKVVDQ